MTRSDRASSPPADRGARADAILGQLQAQARGRLKVFLGAAPGVGKTYAMLSAAHDLVRRRVDVVVGLIETHGRADTEALLEGLETIARRQVSYQGRPFTEIDVDAVLRRRPAVVLVDELAHRNAPGSRHERRFQDIEDLLDAGVDVYTTVNVQHLESLNDVVHQMVGVRVSETVPDAFLDRARDLVLIDLPPRELIERLAQGKVYVPEQAALALERFFSPSNLMALRELAVQVVADRVDADLRDERRARGAGAQPRRRVLVAIGGMGRSETLIRAGRRLSQRHLAPWTVAWIDRGQRADVAVQARVKELFVLARELGADTVTLRGDDVAREISSWAERHDVSTVVMGRARERTLLHWRLRSVVQRLLATAPGFDVTVVGDAEGGLERPEWPGRRPPARTRAIDYAMATAATALAVMVSLALELLAGPSSPAPIFMLAALAVAARCTSGPAIATALQSFLAYNFFFVEPRHTFAIQRPGDVVAVTGFLVAALIASRVAGRLRSQLLGLRAANEHVQATEELGRRLAAAADEDQVLEAGAQALRQAVGAAVIVLRRAGTGERLAPVVTHPPGTTIASDDLAAADWAEGAGRPAGRFTESLASSAWWFVPLGDHGGSRIVVGLLLPPEAVLSAEAHQLVVAMVQDMSQAVDRTRLVADLETARVQSETDQLKTALLSSVSHDLRSPLTSMIGAATSLEGRMDDMPAAAKDELVETIVTEGRRLDRYIQNLLDMTRLGQGPLKIQRDWIGVDEIVAIAVTRLRQAFPETQVVVALPGQDVLLFVHPALVEQALFNVLENAARFTPSGASLAVRARVEPEHVVIDVVDRGPGIPEEERTRIFDMFYSVKRGDQGSRGSGLGLTICRGMIGAHGGRVEALAGDDGIGTTIRLRLPRPEPPPGDDEAA